MDQHGRAIDAFNRRFNKPDARCHLASVEPPHAYSLAKAAVGVMMSEMKNVSVWQADLLNEVESKRQMIKGLEEEKTMLKDENEKIQKELRETKEQLIKERKFRSDEDKILLKELETVKKFLEQIKEKEKMRILKKEVVRQNGIANAQGTKEVEKLRQTVETQKLVITSMHERNKAELSAAKERIRELELEVESAKKLIIEAQVDRQNEVDEKVGRAMDVTLTTLERQTRELLETHATVAAQGNTINQLETQAANDREIRQHRGNAVVAPVVVAVNNEQEAGNVLEEDADADNTTESNAEGGGTVPGNPVDANAGDEPQPKQDKVDPDLDFDVADTVVSQAIQQNQSDTQSKVVNSQKPPKVTGNKKAQKPPKWATDLLKETEKFKEANDSVGRRKRQCVIDAQINRDRMLATNQAIDFVLEEAEKMGRRTRRRVGRVIKQDIKDKEVDETATSNEESGNAKMKKKKKNDRD